MCWLLEIYGKEPRISKRQLLRHRDLSYVERLCIDDAMPASLIYKVVLPPWDIEQDLHEHILIPSLSNSARLYLSGTFAAETALFMEDLGERTLLNALSSNAELPVRLGTELAKLHRAYTYRIPELQSTGVLRTLSPQSIPDFVQELVAELSNWLLVDKKQEQMLDKTGLLLAKNLANEPISLVHGDLYAENMLFDGEHLFIIDWSWFTKISLPILDLATLSMEHFKNGALVDHRQEIIEAYCQEYSRDLREVTAKLPLAELFGRLLFLEWLVERRRRGIMGTTVGPVDILIASILAELDMRYKSCSQNFQ